MKRILCAAVIGALGSPLFAAGTSHWVHTSEADFKNGRFHNTVATNLGDVKLSRAVKTLLEQDPRVSAVYALAEAPDGTIYAATGPHGIILQVKDEKVSTAATLKDENIFALAVDQAGRLLIGTGGAAGRILRIDKPGAKPVEVFAAEGVQYVWQVRLAPDGTIYAGTGPNGQVFQVKPNGTHSVLFDSDENNILSLISDGKDSLFAGTDPNGLVYRINRKTGDAFALFDAPEAEISALALDAKGNLYAGTAQPGDEAEGPASRYQTEQTGRPEGGEKVVPLPSVEPKDPAPPELPDPDPAEPDPIPKNVHFSVTGPDLSMLLYGEAAAPMPPQPRRRTGSAGASTRSRGSGAAAPEVAADGNAIYRIDSHGFVSEVFRQPVMVLSLAESNGTLLVGTGSDGLVYQVNPAAEETTVLAKVDPKQVMAMLPTKDGRVVLGLANVGGLAAMSSGFAQQGTYTSPVLDASQISRFGKLHLQGSLPPGATLTIATRSGNVREPGDTGWAKWSAEVPATEYVQIPSPPARFLQYRLTLKSENGVASPVVDAVDVAHKVPNVAPRIQAIQIGAANGEDAGNGSPAAGSSARTIAWEATDLNADDLVYTLHYRTGAAGPWIELAKDVKQPQYQWNTRGVADGNYQIRITASDARANPSGEGRSASRVSDPVVVDNTAPVIGDLKVTRNGDSVSIAARVVDRTSRVAAVAYAVDSKDDWQSVAASDMIFDSPEEGVLFSIDHLAAGLHQITLRASDDHGNQAYETIPLTIVPADK